MKIIVKTQLWVLFLFLQTFSLFSQEGTITSPFTSLEQTLSVPNAGNYYFSLNGQDFNTYVDASGFVQVAIDFGDGSGNLPQSFSLTNTSRGILQPSVLATLTQANEVRITSSTGQRDVISTNADVLSRIASNTTIHRGSIDNTINDSWTGTGAVYFTGDATGGNTSIDGLHQRVFQPMGNGATFHWSPRNNQQRESKDEGEIANSEYLQVWVRKNTNSNNFLPVQFLNFKANLNPNRKVELSWQTQTEVNNAYFMVERSMDARQWQELEIIDGAGNSSEVLTYFTLDEKPARGFSYYRIKQIDIDGDFSYSPIQSVDLSYSEEVTLYPNPATEYVLLSNYSEDIEELIITDIKGIVVNSLVTISRLHEKAVRVDLMALPSGFYFIKVNSRGHKFYKK